jgi:3,4-dihydroxy 2-butanone 4-phosphate synthase / GTP cyclohydrolase II
MSHSLPADTSPLNAASAHSTAPASTDPQRAQDTYLPASLSPPEKLIEAARAGRMIILVDDENRENEGDLILPAQMVTPETINFIAKYARGLICLAMDHRRIAELGLPPMTAHNGSRHGTAFTVSIGAREGVTTGISAADRAHTVQVAIDPRKGRQDIVTPGHIFPLEAREGGVLVRAGHTEAAVDIARLAGLIPAGVLCEIMNEDGTMARLLDLQIFAARHGLLIGTIADLIAYRRRTETLVERRLTTPLKSRYGGDFTLHLYVNKVTYAEHLALVKGSISQNAPTLVRVHALSVLGDVLGEEGEGAESGALAAAMMAVAKAQNGVVVLIREPSPVSVSERLIQRLQGEKTPPDLRDYGIGAQILLDLGVRKMRLLSNSRRALVGLEGYGLEIIGHEPLILPGALSP